MRTDRPTPKTASARQSVRDAAIVSIIPHLGKGVLIAALCHSPRDRPPEVDAAAGRAVVARRRDWRSSAAPLFMTDEGPRTARRTAYGRWHAGPPRPGPRGRSDAAQWSETPAQ